MKKDTNLGKHNSGDVNSGNRNSGDRNSGDYNSGDYNSGDCNSGDCNSGDYNSGNRNSGNCNSGNCNSGNRNSGNRNSGNYNSGDYNSGFFNTNIPNVRLFNKETNLKRNDIDIPYIYLKLTEWISEDNMTDLQKKNEPDFHIKKGTLIERSYHEAWKLYWEEDSTEEERQKFLNLPNFDKDIFKEITGIDVNKSDSCNGKVVEIDGKKYKLSEMICLLLITFMFSFNVKARTFYAMYENKLNLNSSNTVDNNNLKVANMIEILRPGMSDKKMSRLVEGLSFVKPNRLKLVLAIIKVESDFRINAYNKKSNDYGLMQINEYHVKKQKLNKHKLLTNVIYNIQIGTGILKWFISRYDGRVAIARYNCGTRRNCILKRSVRKYVRKVLYYKNLLKGE